MKKDAEYYRLRDNAEHMNAVAIGRILQEYHCTLPRDTGGYWRATRRVWGDHPVWPGVALECLATDGLLALFRDVEHRLYEGHVQHFTWREEERITLTVEDAETGEEKRITVKQSSGAPPPMFGTSGRSKRSVSAEGHAKKQRRSALDDVRALLGL